ncbi:LysR family transcriptional regulator [Breoghania sp. JC706]|uniref:LysR family transcriptional regulator n=1 Tax=Breoghania sp. JC706 TaxID=3117732 RepID=UPI00300952EE
MDHLDALRLFVRVVERGSFTAAAADLNLPRSTATEALRRLERRLGARLLERTTRHVAPTPDGQAFYERCVAILADMEDAEAVLRDADPRGRLRIDAPALLTRTVMLPHLPAFLERYPRLDIQFGQSDRLVDLVREGIDCAIRAGDPVDSDLMLRPLGELTEITVASPGYLDRFGTPERLDDLDGHQMVGFLSSRTGEVMPLEFTDGATIREMRLRSRVSANNSDTVAELARLGFGLAQAPGYRFAADIAAGRLVEVLAAYRPRPMPLSALYPRGRQLAPRLRVFLDWATDLFAASGL